MNRVPSRLVHCVALLLGLRAFASPDQAIVEPIEVTTSYANAGDPVAQFNLGVSYRNGEGAEKDAVKALSWFTKAAEGKFAPAEHALGMIYASGQGAPRDDAAALKWMTLAAGHGSFDAQKELVRMYGLGVGAPKNPALALSWDFIARRTLELLHEKPAGEPPKPAALRKDGAAEFAAKDGTKKIIHPDGGEETAGPEGARVITYKNRVKTITPDKTAITKYPSGHVETEFPDGRTIMRDPNGTMETKHPDGRKDREYDAKDTRGRQARVTENLDKEGKRIGRTIVRGNVTIRENAEGPFSVETVLTDTAGVKVKLTEEIQPNGKVGQRKLARLDTGAEPKGTEVWTIQREIETATEGTILVEETYSSLGIGEQRVIPRQAQSQVRVVQVPVNIPETNMNTVPAQTMVAMPNSARSVMTYGPPSVLKEPVDITPMVKELEKLELQTSHFAGASEADWAKAKAFATNWVIPLAKPPQVGRGPNWLSIGQLSGGTLPVPPFTRALDDGSKEFAFGLHGRDVIKQPGWKHAQTPHFVVHYIEETDARQTMLYIEGAYTIITRLLGLDETLGKQKGHVFLFANENAWKAYLVSSKNSPQLAGFAYKNELLLPAVVEKEGGEDSVKTLCHEVTHAILARFYPGAKPPLWLNEGFAEYIAARTIALKRGHAVEKYMSTKADRPMKLDPVFRRIRYGVPSRSALSDVFPIRNTEEHPVMTFYANAAWCARALVEKLPPEGLPKFFNAISAGNSPNASFRFAYGDKCTDASAFAKIVDAMEMPKNAK